ncbi:MAG: CoA transferase, partial [Candidatus Puniceispirillaceae bacterium]
MSKPLESIRVLDMTNVLAGPFCCHHLAHLGAEVIKVEAVGRGDLARQLGADPELSNKNMGVSFLAQNAGKKSVTVNLKHPQGKALFLKLVKTADVVVENFRPGVMHRLGVGYEVLQGIRPEIIYCAISGFGQEGPWVHRP